MSEHYCPTCGTRHAVDAQNCQSCARPLPGTAAHRRHLAGKRKTAAAAIVLGAIIVIGGFMLEGGARLVATRRGSSTAGTIKGQILITGAALAGYGVVSLYRLRADE